MQPVPILPAMEYAERSDPGRDPEKQVNEDACVHRETRFGHLCIVCDGMGGHAAGREAAELAVSIVLDIFEHPADGALPSQVMRTAIEQANRAVYAMHTNELGSGRPGCTIVAALMHAQGTDIAHVGDSRAYLVHGGQIFRMTRDHSIVQELVDRGLLTPLQAAHHPDANRITRALGIAPVVEVDVRHAPVHHVAGDAFVLCSDGLSDLVEEHEVLAIVAGEPAAQAVGKLVDLANARGGHDNITVIVLRARESAMATPPTVTPTVAQTSVPEARRATVPPGRPSERPKPFFTEVTLPLSPSLAPPLTPRALPAPTRPAERPPGTAVVAFGILIACVAAGLLGAVLVRHFAERRGKQNTTSPSAIESTAMDAGGGIRPATLAPESVVLPPPAAPPAEPIAPLEPSPADSKKKRKR